MTKKKVIAIVVTTIALTVGSIGVAGAASKASQRVSITKSSTKIAGQVGVGPEQALATILKDLVSKGTLTQAQADAVTAAVSAAKAAADANRPEGGKGPKDGRGGHGHEHGGPRGGGMGGATAPTLPAPSATPRA